MTHAWLWIVVLAMPTAVAAAESTRPAAPPIGRLFYTPAERAALDLARRAKPAPQAPQAEAPPAAPPPQVVSYGGIVRRSDGKAMLWINNRLVEEKEALEGLNLKGKVRPDGAVTLQVPDTGGSIEVKVGQSVEVQTGKVAETRKQREAAARDAKAARESGMADTPGTAAGEEKTDAGPQPAPPPPGAASAAPPRPAPGSLTAR